MYELNLGYDRIIISKAATLLGKARLLIKGATCEDILSGFFGIKTKFMQDTNKNRFEMQGYKILFDILKNIKKGTKIKNIYYNFGMRKKGHSKIRKKHMMFFLRSLFS